MVENIKIPPLILLAGIPDWPGVAVFLQNALIFFRYLKLSNQILDISLVLYSFCGLAIFQMLLAWNLFDETLAFSSAIQSQHKFKFQTSNEMVKIDTL